MYPRLFFLALLVLSYALAAGDIAAQSTVQRTSAQGVTVVVTPQNIGASAKVWEFKVVLDTHSQELRDDLAKTAVLVDADGRQAAPLGWEGAPPGGHHREGVLRFEPIVPLPKTIELRIQRPGEAAARTFRWTPAAN